MMYSDIVVSKATKDDPGSVSLRIQSKDKRALQIAALKLSARLLEELEVDEVSTNGTPYYLGEMSGYRMTLTAKGVPGTFEGKPLVSKWVRPGPPPLDALKQALSELPESLLSNGARAFLTKESRVGSK